MNSGYFVSRHEEMLSGVTTCSTCDS